MPTDILLYALIAAGLIIWLRNTLGIKDDDEPQRKNPIIEKEKEKNNVIQAPDIMQNNIQSRMQSSFVENQDASFGLKSISNIDKSFNSETFLNISKDVLVMIIEAFAKGDKDLLNKLLAPSVYKAFESAIDTRIEKGETVETEVHAIRKAEIIEAKIENKLAFITVKFKAEETCVIRDSSGNILSGNPERITEMTDIWVFGRNLKSSDPTWFLYETRDDEEEDHKTPLPESKHE